MKKLTKFWVAFLQDEEGATMVEYGLMVALIAVVAIAAVTLLGTEVEDTFDKAQSKMHTANNPA
ncbi:MAG: hypothetical protein BA874_13110 [Desulfuromonadales bacterium C00003068]|nr:MAG: hypothetical protein BA874_13110 [Desulfuromonadales bacterium C00003068]